MLKPALIICEGDVEEQNCALGDSWTQFLRQCDRVDRKLQGRCHYLTIFPNKVVFMKNGEIAEQGVHENLMKKKVFST